MPGRDRTGPMGMGPRTGRGMGFCNATKAIGVIGGLGLGLGYGRRIGRRLGRNFFGYENTKESLMEEKSLLQNRIDLLNKELDAFEDDK